MKVYPGSLLLKTQGLNDVDRVRYYDAVFHLWGSVALTKAQLEARVGALSEEVLRRFDVSADGSIYLAWLDVDREQQTRIANKNRGNGKLGGRGKKAKPTGFTTGLTTGKANGKATPVPIPLPVPEFLKEAWSEFRLHRIDLKEPMTERSERALLKQVEAMGPEFGVLAVRNSIANGWKGVFPVKQNGTTHATEQTFDGTPLSVLEKFRLDFEKEHGRLPGGGDKLPKGYSRWKGWI